MGVIKGTRELFGSSTPDDMDHILEPVYSSEDEPVVPIMRRRTPRPKPKRQTDLEIGEAIANRRRGAKQARRCDNLRELISMVEKEDLELDFNIFEPTISAFAELFSEREKMQVWNDFVNSTEEEQQVFLQSGQGHSSHNNGHYDNQVDDLGNNNAADSDLDNSWEKIPDKRSTHPSFSARACFQKLDKNIKSLLKRRQRPMGMLVSLEEEIVQFFTEWPTSVYISKLSSSYERMMLHALCQYLDLISKSHDCDGLRQTQVENPQSLFTPPPVLLTQYLEGKRVIT